MVNESIINLNNNTVQKLSNSELAQRSFENLYTSCITGWKGTVPDRATMMRQLISKGICPKTAVEHDGIRLNPDGSIQMTRDRLSKFEPTQAQKVFTAKTTPGFVPDPEPQVAKTTCKVAIHQSQVQKLKVIFEDFIDNFPEEEIVDFCGNAAEVEIIQPNLPEIISEILSFSEKGEKPKFDSADQTNAGDRSGNHKLGVPNTSSKKNSSNESYKPLQYLVKDEIPDSVCLEEWVILNATRPKIKSLENDLM